MLSAITRASLRRTGASYGAAAAAAGSSSARKLALAAQPLRTYVEHKAPVRDQLFVLNEVLDAPKAFQKHNPDCTPDLVDSILDEIAKFSEQRLGPLNAVGDSEGCTLQADGTVTTPSGWAEAYQEYAAAGWQSLSMPEEYGGQNLPMSLSSIKAESIATTNWSFGMYPGLSLGCINTLLRHGTDAQKEMYLPKLATGEWTGCMDLTEPHCGSDLGQLTTKAIPQPDGSYKLTGTKIFISCGEHEMSDNIIHIVLARLPDAPEGTKGISLFIVPKYLVGENGELATERNVECVGLEEKMGIHGSSTCVMNYDSSTGFMLGTPNRGLNAMFVFMNTARLGTGIQGIAAAEQAYQSSVAYAKERMSMRSLSGTKHKDKKADPIIVHPDVRKMLLTQRAVAEGGRCLLYHACLIGDQLNAEGLSNKEFDEIDSWLGLHTPIVKGVLTELGLEAAAHGVQIFGGHGFIKGNGMEHIYRDARIGTLYEGTTGIQALDLLARKVLLNKGKHLIRYVKEILGDCKDNAFSPTLGSYARTLATYAAMWPVNSAIIAARAARDRDVVNAACVDYLMYSGYISLGHFWLKMAVAAEKGLKNNPSPDDKAFYEGKLATAAFYFDRMLPRADSHAKTMVKSSKSIMAMKEEHF